MPFNKKLLFFNSQTHRPKVEPNEATDGKEQWGMFCLIDKPSNDSQIIDVVALHGLNGHYRRTWTAETSDGVRVNWLQDLLPNRVPNARILSFGYDSGVQFSKSVSGISEFADQFLEGLMAQRASEEEQQRPVIIICHSLGGLVFKQALVKAHERERYADLLKHIQGVAFFGTPHRGSGVAAWANIFANIIEAASFGISTNANLTKDLKEKSGVLSQISTSFIERGTDLSIFSFYETQKFPGMNCRIVDKDSAIIGWPNETPIPIDGDHRSICRFSLSTEAETKRWQVVSFNIGFMARKALQKTAITKDTLIVVGAQAQNIESYRINFSLEGVPCVNNFVNRPFEMKELEDILLPISQRSRQKVFILNGLGGMGKTQLAIEFARRHHPGFSSVFWLDGRSHDILKQSIAASARRIPIGQIPESSRTYSAGQTDNLDVVVAEVINWFSKSDNNSWLLIFDNVDHDYQDPQATSDAYDLRRYFPKADHGSILVTTRLVNLEQLGTRLTVSKVDKDQALAIFRNRYRRDFEECEESRKLLDLLDGLPLALAQASAFMRETGTSFADYISFYKEQWVKLQDEYEPLQEYPNRTVWTTWTVSYKAIQRRDECAANLLLLWASLDNNDLWFELLQPAFIWVSSMKSSVFEWVQKIAGNKLAFSKSMKLLLGYSMIEGIEGSSSYSTHSVVHEWAWQIQQEDERTQFTRLATLVIGLAFPHRSRKQFWIMQRRLLPHADCCTLRMLQVAVEREAQFHLQDYSNTSKEVISLNSVTLSAFHNIGELYKDQGKLAQAEEMYQRALAGKEKAFGPDHMSTLDTINNLGILYSNQGKLAQAEEMYQRALAGYEKAFGPEDRSISKLNTINNLGLLYSNQGKLAQAEEMYQRALAGYEKAFGPEDRSISKLNTINNLGLLYSNQGKLAQAEEMYQRALAGKEKAFGPDHMSTLDTINNLGILYSNQGKLAQAEEIYQRALAGKEKALGPEHTSTLNTINNLGLLYSNQGKLAQAEEMYQRALAGKEKALEPEHTSTLNTINNLGLLYSNQGKLAQAEEMYQRALAGKEKALGPDHTSTLDTINNLGLLYSNQGKLAQAEEMYQRALVRYEKALGPEHTSTLNTINNLGSLYRNQGKLAQAEEMYQLALAGYEKAFGPQDRSIPKLNTINNLGLLYSDQGKLVQAEEMYQRALAGKEKALGPEHTSTLNTINNLGLLYSDQGKLAQAEEMYRRALAGYEKALGPAHTSTLNTMNNLGNLYKRQGKLAQAEIMYQRVQEGK